MRASDTTPALAAALLAALVLAGCGDSDDVQVLARRRDRTETTGTTGTTAAPTTTTSSASTTTTGPGGAPTTAAAQPTTTPPARPGPAPAPSGPIRLVARNVAFDPERLEAPAGRVTIRFDNQDGGILHNVHVKGLPGGDAMTEFEAGPVVQELELEVDRPGSYEFVCDVHPAQMVGTLVVR